jgi:esterase/lipase
MLEHEVFASHISTTVRVDDFKKFLKQTYLHSIGMSINALSVVAPNLAAKVALNIWGKTRLKRFTPRGVFKNATPEFIEINDKQIATYRFGTGNGPTVMLIHGWEGEASDFYKMIEPLVELGHQVLLFDGPAHGQSQGTHSNLFEFVEVIETLAKKEKIHVAIGHSMGGAAMSFSHHYSQHFKPAHLITMGSPNHLEQMINGFANFLNLNSFVRAEISTVIESVIAVPVKDISVERLLSNTESLIMNVHDEHDDMVPYSRAVDIMQKLPNAYHLPTRNLGHVKILRNEYVLDEILQFIGQRK